MRLKRLVVQGFKSFAHSTFIDFASGLTVVVGPNGSGKSNVIDALRWVLGDHYREMRVTQNREVIFHGSPSAKPLGMAYIETEWIDEQGDQFNISRKLFSSGDSEYAFNHNRIRLRELKDLVYRKGFPGETIGVNVVDNSKLQTLFDYRPAERYRLFEMSSGLYGMRQRLLRLGSQVERVSEKLERLCERIAEVELQERRVAKLAQDEQGFLELMSEVRELKRVFLDRAITLREQKCNDLDQEIGNAERLTSVSDHALSTLTQTIQLTRDELAKRQSDRDVLETELSRLNEERQSIERDLYSMVTRARQRAWMVYESHEILRRSDQERRHLENKLSELREILQVSEVLDREIEEMRVTRNQYRDQERKASGEFFQIQQNASVALGLYRQNERETTDLEDEIAELEGELYRTRQRIVHDSETLVMLNRDREESHRQDDTIRQKTTKVAQLVLRLEKKAGYYLNAGRMEKDWGALAKALNDDGWSGAVLYALAWLMKERELFPNGGSWPEERDLFGSGQVMIHRNVLPPCEGWKIVPLATIQDLFLRGTCPEKNLVSPGGELLYLRSGFLHFPRKVLFEEFGANFFRSFNRRREFWRLKQKSLEESVMASDRRLDEITQQIIRQENEVERRQERVDVLEGELEKKRERLERLHERERDLAVAQREGKELTEQGQAAVSQWRDKGIQIEHALAEKEKARLDWERLRANQERFRAEVDHLERGCERAVNAIESVHSGIKASEMEFLDLVGRMDGNRLALEQYQERVTDVHNQCRRLNGELELLYQHYEQERDRNEQAAKLRDKAMFAREKTLYETQELRRRLEELGPFPGSPGDVSFSKDQRVLEQLISQKEAHLQTWNVRRGAIEEYDELKQRGDVLRTKFAGYEQGMSRFRKEYAECDREIRRRFCCYVDTVNTLFAGYFTRIFEGGEAGVALTGDGLEISIRIPGKRKQSLSLLSSGEKALCGLCLFLGLFRAGSFLFCFFDEVDANLDHFNSNRLAGVLQDYANQCQVVIVTHQEEIMEIADRIIGVTMAEPGVSRVVPLESFQEVERFEAGQG